MYERQAQGENQLKERLQQAQLDKRSKRLIPLKKPKVMRYGIIDIIVRKHQHWSMPAIPQSTTNLMQTLAIEYLGTDQNGLGKQRNKAYFMASLLGNLQCELCKRWFRSELTLKAHFTSFHVLAPGLR